MNRLKYITSPIFLNAEELHRRKHFHIWVACRLQLPWNKMRLLGTQIDGVLSISTISSVFQLNVKDKCSWEDEVNEGFCGTYEDFNVLCKEGRLNEALGILYQTDHGAVWEDTNTYSALLQGCIKGKSLAEGKKVHAKMIKHGLASDSFLQNNLVNLYGKCGDILDARLVFDKMCERNLVSWTTMMTGYTQHGFAEEALKLFCRMKTAGMSPNEFTFGTVLRACAGLEALHEGNQIHACILKSGYESDIFSGSALIDMYAKCGNMEDARQVFDEMPKRNAVSWNTIIAGCVLNWDSEEALKLFSDSQLAGIIANHFTFASVLKACATLTVEEHGKQLHAYVIKSQFESDVFVGSALIDMYTKCCNIEDASKVFQNMPKRDAVLWSGMIAGYTQHGHAEDALKLYCQMHRISMKLDHFTFASVLSACAIADAVEQGNQVHAYVIKAGFQSEVFVGTALVDMYAKFGFMTDAQNAFDEISEQNETSWNAMIAGYIQNECSKEALQFVSKMQRAGKEPNQFTYSNSLRACASRADLEHGSSVHAQIIKSTFESNVFVGSALIDMYVKCGSIEDASQVFNTISRHDVVSWTAMIAGYAQYDYGEEALKLFSQMQSTGLKPNQFTVVIILNTCGSLAALEQGKQFHAQITKSGFESDMFVGSALVDMYAKSGNIEDADKVFYKLSDRDMVSWSAMITGYSQHGHGVQALKLFCQMQRLGMKGDQFTFSSSLAACASLTALEQGKAVHAHIIKTGFGLDVFVESALVDMYSKCGSIKDSRNIFDRMTKRNSVSWTAMVVGYAQHGQVEEALQIFEQMQLAGVKPDSITFVGVLSACSHAGLVDMGRHYFDSMSRDHGMTPKLEHYACMVDLLGRAGNLYEAEEFINKIPFEPPALVWRTLLGACRIHGNMELGKRAAEWVLELDPLYPATYVLLSNIYAAAGKWDDVTKVRNMMKDRGVRKEPGRSWIELKNKWHAFVVADRSHPETEMIYAELQRLTGQMKEAGYIPDTNFLLHNVEE